MGKDWRLELRKPVGEFALRTWYRRESLYRIVAPRIRIQGPSEAKIFVLREIDSLAARAIRSINGGWQVDVEHLTGVGHSAAEALLLTPELELVLDES
jgi:methenyltetrahydromethanopterin cyclohydrolase